MSSSVISASWSRVDSARLPPAPIGTGKVPLSSILVFSPDGRLGQRRIGQLPRLRFDLDTGKRWRGSSIAAWTVRWQ